MRLSGHILRIGLCLAVPAGCTVEPPKPVVEAPTGPPPGALSQAAAKAAAEAAKNAEGAPPDLLAARPTRKVETAELMNRVTRYYDTGNLPGALKALDEVLAIDPDNRQALTLTSMVAQRQAAVFKRPQNSALYLKSADALRKVVALKVDLSADEKAHMPEVFYNEACTFAIAGESGRALKALAESIDAGFALADHFDTDAELDSLRKLPEFQALQRKLERKAVGLRIAANKPWRLDFRLPDLDGKTFAFDDVKGKLTVVDFWGTWCPPCRKEIPHFAELLRRYGDKGLKIVGLDYEEDDSEASRQAAREFVKTHAISYPNLVGDKATKQLVPKFDGYPTTLFVDDKGMVRLQLTGYQSLAALDVAVGALLVPEKPAAKEAVKK